MSLSAGCYGRRLCFLNVHSIGWCLFSLEELSCKQRPSPIDFFMELSEASEIALVDCFIPRV